MAGELVIPYPSGLEDWTWLLIGLMFARAFGKPLDYWIQRTSIYARLPRIGKLLVKSLANFLHHFWVGLLLMTYASLTAFPNPVFWFGAGLFLADMPDVPERFRKYFRGFIDGEGNTGSTR